MVTHSRSQEIFETMLLASNYIRYGGKEYEEATYGGMVVMKMNMIKKRFA